MAIKTEKFKNIYGINELKGVGEVNGNALIYAPNGGTKTSLALGFKHISTGIMPNDRIFENNAEYKFELDNKMYVVETTIPNYSESVGVTVSSTGIVSDLGSLSLIFNGSIPLQPVLNLDSTILRNIIKII